MITSETSILIIVCCCFAGLLWAIINAIQLAKIKLSPSSNFETYNKLHDEEVKYRYFRIKIIHFFFESSLNLTYFYLLSRPKLNPRLTSFWKSDPISNEEPTPSSSKSTSTSACLSLLWPSWFSSQLKNMLAICGQPWHSFWVAWLQFCPDTSACVSPFSPTTAALIPPRNQCRALSK